MNCWVEFSDIAAPYPYGKCNVSSYVLFCLLVFVLVYCFCLRRMFYSVNILYAMPGNSTFVSGVMVIYLCAGVLVMVAANIFSSLAYLISDQYHNG